MCAGGRCGGLTFLELQGGDLGELLASGLLRRFNRRDLVIWEVTSSGRQRLMAARHSGEPGELPESPQHKAWRRAREAAAEKIAALREELRGALSAATGLLDSESKADSEAWFKFSDRLQDICWDYASATYCLSEWPEPNDSAADIDRPAQGQRHRRETQRWHRR